MNIFSPSIIPGLLMILFAAYLFCKPYYTKWRFKRLFKVGQWVTYDFSDHMSVYGVKDIRLASRSNVFTIQNIGEKYLQIRNVVTYTSIAVPKTTISLAKIIDKC